MMIEADRAATSAEQIAEYVGGMLTESTGGTERAKLLLRVTATAVGSAVLLVLYYTLLSRMGVTTSIPALAVILLASTLSSIAGFAFSAICGAMLLHIMADPVRTVEVLMVCSIAIQSFSVVMLWRDIGWKALSRFVLGGVAGLPIGVWLLLHLGAGTFRQAIGGLLTAYVAYGLLKRPVTVKSSSTAIDAAVGWVGGIIGGLAAFPGAAVTIWCGMRGWDKQLQRGIYQPYILIMQVMALGIIGYMREGQPHMDALSLATLQFVPAAMLGTWFGLNIFKRISDRTFTLTINALLLLSGIGLLAQ